MLLKGKIYYAWPVFPILFAGGGLAIESWFDRLRFRWLKPAFAVTIAIGGILIALMSLPVLSPEHFMWFQTKLHLAPPEIEHQRTGPLRHQTYADMFGWKELAEETARAYNRVPAGLRDRTAIAAGNYGSAGAIDFFGPKLGLPKAISGHQNYWFWGPRNYTGESVLLLDTSLKGAKRLCDAPQSMGRVAHTYSREDQHFGIYWCHPLKRDLQQNWAKAKHWD
jgi:hypothetical protein